jgi:hypothetical protein
VRQRLAIEEHARQLADLIERAQADGYAVFAAPADDAGATTLRIGYQHPDPGDQDLDIADVTL